MKVLFALFLTLIILALFIWFISWLFGWGDNPDTVVVQEYDEGPYNADYIVPIATVDPFLTGAVVGAVIADEIVEEEEAAADDYVATPDVADDVTEEN